MDDEVKIQEDSFSSDEDFDDEDEELSESSTDVDEKIKNEEIFDKDFLKCYSALKRKDDKIYDKDVKFFQQKVEDESKEELDSLLNPNKKVSKPKMTLLDHQLSLKEDGIDEIEQIRLGEDEPVKERIKPMLSHYERELDDLKKEILKAGEDDDSDSDSGDFLIRKDVSSNHQPVIAKTRKSKIEAIPDDGDTDIKELKTIWSNSKELSDEDKFLRDYIINKRYISNIVEDDEPNDASRYFSKDIDKLSDIEPDSDDEETKKSKSRKIARAKFHSDEVKFDEIKRIPRNATQTIRDLNEKRMKKEKRLKKVEKRKKLKKKLDETEEEFRYRQGKEDKEELRKIMEEIDMELKSLPATKDGDHLIDDITEGDKEAEAAETMKKKKKKKKRGGQKKPKVGVAPDRLLSYGLSKRKLKKSKLL